MPTDKHAAPVAARSTQRLYTVSQKKTRAQLLLGLADRTHGALSQPASITVRV